MHVIETENLHKRYSTVDALQSVNLKINRGEVFGLLGQNGAGKTTLIKILLGIVKRTSGNATLLGEPVGTSHIRRKVGYLPEDHQFPAYHSAYSLMEYFGKLYGMSRDDRKRQIMELLDRVGLVRRMHEKIRRYSKGMKQRVGVAQALFHDPEVIFLDEPTDGVDPVGRREIRAIIEERRAQGATIFVNSHLLGEIELMCDRVVVMDRGQIIRAGTIEELTQQKGTFDVRLAESDFPKTEIERLGATVNQKGELWQLVLPDNVNIDTILNFFSSKGLRLRHLVENRMSLEDLFIKLVDDEDQKQGNKTTKRRAN
ncbi:MAG: ABC transporter ATP-binding protein [Zavarzinella sp.]